MIRYIKPVSIRSPQGLTGRVYRQISEEFGVLGEPLTLHSPLPELLAGVWCSFRESVLSGIVTRKYKEIVAVAVSQLNQCPYCIDAHTIMLRATSSHEAAFALQFEQDDPIADPRMRALIAWARATRSPGSRVLSTPPFTRQEGPEIIGTALWIHYINRMVKAFLGRHLLPISSNRFGLRSLSERMGGLFFAGVVKRQLQPGTSLDLMRPAPLQPDLTWAASSPTVSKAFAGLAAAAEEAGSAHLSSEVRACVSHQLETWSGADPGLGCNWLAGPLGSLTAADQAAGRLAMLTALAPDRLGEDVVREYRKTNGSDAALLGAVAWSSFAVARRIGTWLYL